MEYFLKVFIYLLFVYMRSVGGSACAHVYGCSQGSEEDIWSLRVTGSCETPREGAGNCGPVEEEEVLSAAKPSPQRCMDYLSPAFHFW